jgi:hypothetical protein
MPFESTLMQHKTLSRFKMLESKIFVAILIQLFPATLKTLQQFLLWDRGAVNCISVSV